MQYHIDREILFKKENEHKSLYSWYLQEFKNNKAVGNKFIPWGWALCFDASELKLVKHIEIEGGDVRKRSSSEHIQAKITPEESEYSMFGSDRKIKDFTLTIRQLENDSDTEKCSCWGIVSYTAETDFIDETTDDVVSFEAWLHPKNYNDIRQFAYNKFNDDTLKLSLKGSGFYSEWTPSISTDYIKVLAQGLEQKIKEEVRDVSAPRLGEIWDFSLYITRSNVLRKSSAADEILDSYLDEGESNSKPKLSRDNDLLFQLIRTQASIRKLYLPVWLIAILLFLVFLK